MCNFLRFEYKPFKPYIRCHALYQMNIAINTRFLIKGKLEGFGHFTHETLKRMCQAHPEHRFYFLFDRSFDPSFLVSDNCEGVILHPPARHPILWYIWFEWSVKRWLQKNKPDIFISTDGYACLGTDVKQICVIHDLAFEHFGDAVNSLVVKYMRYFTPKFCNKVKRIATVSEYSKQDIMKQYNIDSDKIDVVYNGARELYHVVSDDIKIQTRNEFSSGEAYFLSVSSMHPRKNIVRVLKAFDAFKKANNTKTKLLLVGRMAWKTGEIMQVYEAMAYKSDVIFTGYINDDVLARITASARAMVYVSLFEGFGIPIIEAMQCGVPVICSNNTSCAEVASNAALLVDPYKTDSIKDAFIEIESNQNLRLDFTQKGLENCKRFSWELTANKLWDAVIKTMAE